MASASTWRRSSAATGNGELVPNPPVVELIAEDPMLADTKIIAEAWDAAGAYQVGSFANLRWAEWNGRYRDDVRRFWRGDGGMTGPMATRLAGSSDLYQPSGRRPYHSINFITSHDGFTLNDLVSYEREAQRGQRRGQPRRRQQQLQRQLRRRRPDAAQERSTSSAPAADQEHAGDAAAEPGRADDRLPATKCRRTQRGNNNAYCQDNADQLVRLEAGRAERRDAAVRAGAHRVPPPPAERPPRRVPHRQSRASRASCPT